MAKASRRKRCTLAEPKDKCWLLHLFLPQLHRTCSLSHTHQTFRRMWYISARRLLFWVLVWVFCGGAGHIVGISCYMTSDGNELDSSNEIRCMQIINLDVCAKQSKLGRHGPLLQVYTAKPSITDTNMLRAILRGLSKVNCGSRFPLKTGRHRQPDLLF